MDWLTKSPAYSELGPQLMTVKVLEICAGVLLLLALLTFTVGWARHRSRRLWLLAFVPLAVGIAAGIAAHALHDTYGYWVYVIDSIQHRHPVTVQDRVEHGVTNANQMAAVLGWVFVIVTGMLVVFGLFDLWRPVMFGRPRKLSVPVAPDS